MELLKQLAEAATSGSVSRLASDGPGQPGLSEGVAEDGGEVVAVGGLVTPGGQPLLLQRLQGGVRGAGGKLLPWSCAEFKVQTWI